MLQVELTDVVSGHKQVFELNATLDEFSGDGEVVCEASLSTDQLAVRPREFFLASGSYHQSSDSDRLMFFALVYLISSVPVGT